MAERWLRHKIDGTIYGWDPILAKHPKCEEVSEEVAFPEKFVKPKTVKKATQARKKRGTTLDLSTPEDDADNAEAPKPNPFGKDASAGTP